MGAEWESKLINWTCSSHLEEKTRFLGPKISWGSLSGFLFCPVDEVWLDFVVEGWKRSCSVFCEDMATWTKWRIMGILPDGCKDVWVVPSFCGSLGRMSWSCQLNSWQSYLPPRKQTYSTNENIWWICIYTIYTWSGCIIRGNHDISASGVCHGME